MVLAVCVQPSMIYVQEVIDGLLHLSLYRYASKRECIMLE
jgi:hypothetical protein